MRIGDSLRRRLSPLPCKSSRRALRAGRRALRLEPLESRHLLAVGFTGSVTVPAVQGIGQMPVRDAEVDISVSINGVKATLSGVTDPNGKYAIVDTNGSLPAELPANAVVTGVAKAAAPGTVPYEVDNPGAYPKAAYTSAACSTCPCSSNSAP